MPLLGFAQAGDDEYGVQPQGVFQHPRGCLPDGFSVIASLHILSEREQEAREHQQVGCLHPELIPRGDEGVAEKLQHMAVDH